MLTYDCQQETTFYQKLQEKKDLDLRDNRGKRHDLAFILLGVIIGLLRKRDGNLSSIHRSMVNNHKNLCTGINVNIPKAISRAQLPRILAKVNLIKFEQLLFETFNIKLNEVEKQWFAGDGKELKGSIKKGSKRGEVIVQLVRHSDRAVLGQSYYNGKKESEKPCLRELIEATNAQSQKITADALHLNPSMTSLINKAGGLFIIGLKQNQKELYQDMIQHTDYSKPLASHTTVEKGHGRLEQREYFYFNIDGEYFDSRWQTTEFKSLFKVIRNRTMLKTEESSTETVYFLSNADFKDEPDNCVEYFEAIRNHWSVEVNNHYRDVTLCEDDLRSKKNCFKNVSWTENACFRVIKKYPTNKYSCTIRTFSR